jgi:hypothetical protein
MDNYNLAKSHRVAKLQSLVLESCEAIAKTLEDRSKEVEQGFKDLEAEKVALAEKNSTSQAVDDSDVLDINAGWQVVRVTRGTLTQMHGSILEAIFSGRWEKQLHRDSKGVSFWMSIQPASSALWTI